VTDAAARRLTLPGEHTAAREIRPLLVLLGLPTFGQAFALSTLTS
jgi:hypothetical protein